MNQRQRQRAISPEGADAERRIDAHLAEVLEQLLRAEQQGLNESLVPLVLVVENVVYAAAAYPAGLLADRLSRRVLLISGALIWFGFVLTTMTVNNAFTQRKPMLTVIDGGGWLGTLLIIGAIVGGMGR